MRLLFQGLFSYQLLGVVGGLPQSHRAKNKKKSISPSFLKTIKETFELLAIIRKIYFITHTRSLRLHLGYPKIKDFDPKVAETLTSYGYKKVYKKWK